MGAANYGTTSAVMAEGQALWDGLQAALNSGYQRLDVEGDNYAIISALRKETTIPWQVKNVIQDIHALLLQAEEVWVTHIYREANMAADWLSKLSHSIADSWLSTECDSMKLRAIVQDDRIGRSLVRRGT